jgi:hypothetical protein
VGLEVRIGPESLFNVVVISDTAVSAQFTANSLPAGIYDVIATLDDQEFTRTSGFMVLEEALGDELSLLETAPEAGCCRVITGTGRTGDVVLFLFGAWALFFMGRMRRIRK